MTDASREDLVAIIPEGASLLVDTSVVLAYLVGREPASPSAEQLFDRFVATGRNRASISTITVGEILVRPFRQSRQAVAVTEGFLRHFAEIRLVDVSYSIAREAAQIRAVTGLAMPDALIVASALLEDADFLVTSDRSWSGRLRDVVPDISIVDLPIAGR